MPEEFLDDPEIGAIVEHMGGEAVSQGMGADLGVEPGLEEVFVEFSPDGACAEPFSMFVDEKGLVIEIFFTGVTVAKVQIKLDGLQCG